MSLVSRAPDSFGKESGNFSHVSVCRCQNVDTTIWLVESHDCKVNYILEVGSTRITISPGKVSLFWPNESYTKWCIHSSNPEDTGYIDTRAKTWKNCVSCVHVTLTYTSSNCILPAHGYTAKVTRTLFQKSLARAKLLWAIVFESLFQRTYATSALL